MQLLVKATCFIEGKEAVGKFLEEYSSSNKMENIAKVEDISAIKIIMGTYDENFDCSISEKGKEIKIAEEDLFNDVDDFITLFNDEIYCSIEDGLTDTDFEELETKASEDANKNSNEISMRDIGGKEFNTSIGKIRCEDIKIWFSFT